MSRIVVLTSLAFLSLSPLGAQEDYKALARSFRDLAAKGSEAIPEIAKYLNDADPLKRAEAVKAIVSIGTQHSLAPLTRALADPDPEVQIRATDGIVNFYLPDYLRNSMSSSLKRSGGNVSGRLSDSNEDVIPSYVEVRQEVLAALGKVLTTSSSFDARANAARAIGVLRGRAAIPALHQALRSKDSRLMFESLIALQKTGDTTGGTGVLFLLRDLDDKVQTAAIETIGLLRTTEALPTLRGLVENPRNDKVRRAALSAMAMMPNDASRNLFTAFLGDKDEKLRAAAAEGLGRLKNPADRPAVQQGFLEERKTVAKLSFAFGAASLGNFDTGREAPIGYLISYLGSRAWQGVAQPLLIELARDNTVRESLYQVIGTAKKEEKIGLVRVLAVSGDRTTIQKLEPLIRDPDTDVANQSLRAVRELKARLP